MENKKIDLKVRHSIKQNYNKIYGIFIQKISIIPKLDMAVVILCFIFQIMAELQSNDLLQTSGSFTEPLPAKLLNLHKKIENISHIRKEAQKQKSVLSLENKIVQLQQNNNHFIEQAQAKITKMKAQFVELKLLAIKSQKQLTLKRNHRQKKIDQLKQLLVTVLLNGKTNFITFEENFNQKYRKIQQELAYQSGRQMQKQSKFEGKLCQILPKTYQMIMSSSKYQQNKLQTIYQSIKAKADSLKQNFLDQQMHEYQILAYINQLVTETAREMLNDIQIQKKQRETHRRKIVKLILQTQYHNSLQNK